MPWFCGREVLLPFAWQKDCVISDKVRKAPEATSPRLSSPFDFLNISFPPFTQPLPTCHLCCWVNTVCLLYRATGCCTCRASGGGAGVGCYARCVCVVLRGGCCRDLVCGQVPEAICISQWVSHLCLTAEIPFPNTRLPPSLSDTHTHKISRQQTQKGYDTLAFPIVTPEYLFTSVKNILTCLFFETTSFSFLITTVLIPPLINTKQHKRMTCPFA